MWTWGGRGAGWLLGGVGVLCGVLAAVGAPGGTEEPAPLGSVAGEPDADLRAVGNLAEYLDPATDLLLEAEEMEGLPEGWREVDEAFLHQPLSGGGGLALAADAEAHIPCRLPGKGDAWVWARSHGAPGRTVTLLVEGREIGACGAAAMHWKRFGPLAVGEEFGLTLRSAGRPYLDCLILTRDASLDASQAGALRAYAGDDRWASVGQEVRFSAAASRGRIRSAVWDLGDGGRAEGISCAHTYAKPGDYRVGLTLTDRAGRRQSATVTAHVVRPPDAVRARIPIRRAGGVRFGHLDGDDAVDFIVSDPFLWVDAYRHDGTHLWSYESPAGFQPPDRREHPLVIWDLDGDGRSEVALWELREGRQELCIREGLTGRPLRSAPWPVSAGYVNGRLAIGNVLGGRPATLLLFNGTGEGDQHQQVDAYAPDLRRLWSYERKGADRLGHYPYSADADGDGRDEVYVSATCLEPDGQVRWLREDLSRDHADSLRLVDLDGDGTLEVVDVHSGQGLYVLDARTGRTKWRWETNHAQQLEVADIRPDVPGLEVIVGDRYYVPGLRARLHLFDARGRKLWSFPEKAVTGNPNLSVADWDGDGACEIAWSNLVLDGRARVVAVMQGHVHHAFDFGGDAREEVLCVEREGDQRFLVVYGEGTRRRRPAIPNRRRDADYLLRRVVNHSHY